MLLELLGIKRDRKTGGLKQTAPNKPTKKQTESKELDDIRITDFGLPFLTVSEAVSGFSYATPEEVKFALCQVVEIANKTVAHLTAGPSAPGTFPSLRISCRVVIDLVCRHLYTPLGKTLVVSPIIESTVTEPD